ncbi:Zinc finger protein ZFAT [Larimichthys crocea]|uniref:Uncharacterized protein n=1 Tax=Larimichthys crocea TaxID=215358 RepID=A0ACD3QUC1_LARCR|nr:Zinc finger protein ZFAT [Larimichthys crocea]
MDGLKAAGSVFMCRLCNLFSPSRSQLLAHCSQLHPQQEPPDDIIVALQPLVGEPVQTLAESPVKRKRGRPKGSTKKTRLDLTEGKANSTRSTEDAVKRKEDGNKEEGNRQCRLDRSNRRQILKHICLREEEEEEDEEENGSICGGAGAECSGSVDPGGADLNQMQQNSARPGVVREKDVGSLKPQRTNRSRISKEGGLATGNKKSVISVVLTEDKTLPGVSKMVPVEDSSAETESVAIQAPPQQSAVFQSQSKSLTSDVTTCEGNTKTDQEQSSDPTSSTTTASRGFQEYSIKQNATSLLQSQLKIFACEFCNKIFKFRHSLVAHLRTHTQEKPFQCPHCDYASAIKANLNVHLRKHTGEKFSCQHCPFNCLSPGHLKVHIERVHLKVKQHCSFCEKKYSDVKNLLKHMEKRHNLKDPAVHQSYQQLRKHLFLYVCCVCDGKFVSSQRLEGHLKESHTELDQEQVFTDCINNSYYLMQPEGGMWGDEEREDPEEGMKEEHRIEQEDGEERTREEGGKNDVGGEEHLELAASKDREQGEEGEGVKSQGESAEELQNAFQQVFSSLQKTRLNMESFQRLRKIYGDLECQYCGKLFWYKVHYNVHVRTHTKEHSHYCSKCSYSSITKSSLKRHQIQKHSGLLLPCSNPGCKYTTSDKYKLQAHLRTHQEQGKSVTCPVCQHSYPEHRLKHHIKTSHPGLTVQRAEKCPYCDSYFLKNSSDFQRHIWAHQGLKPYVCNVCDYAGRSRSNLKTHMNRHNTERRHLCDLCGKKFKSKVTLKSHRLSHTDEGKRFHCSECDFTSVSKPSLLRHMEQHAEFKPFRCAHCHYSCNIAGPLKRHYNMKHPDQKYHNAGPGLPNPEALKQQGGVKCPECEFVYGTKWELNRHLKSKHSLKVVEGTWEVGEAVEAQYVPVDDEEQLTESPVSALQDNVNIQQITEFSSETHDAITSMVAMAPGTVTVVQQLQVADEQEVGNCSNQLMVVNADGGLTGDQVMVVEEAHGLEALTVLTQGENTHHYIVYVQEHTVEIN